MIRLAVGLVVAALPVLAGCAIPGDAGSGETVEVTSADLERGDALAQQEDWAGAATVFERIARSEPGNALAWFKLGDALSESGRLDEAVEATLQAAAFPEIAAESWYNLACLHVRRGQVESAMEALDEAFDAGFADLELMRTDPELAGLRGNPRFERFQGHEFHQVETKDGRRIDYALQLPDSHEPGRAYPVLVAMPPGAQDRSAVEWGMAKLWGLQAARRGWVTVSPAVVMPGWQTRRGRQAMEELLDAVASRIPLAGGRFHLAGCSNGGVSAFHVALAFPSRFQSLTVLPGYPASEADRDSLAKLRDVRVRLLVGGDDDDWVRRMSDVQRRMESLRLDSTLTVFSGEGHVMESLLGGGLMDLLAGASAGD